MPCTQIVKTRVFIEIFDQTFLIMLDISWKIGQNISTRVFTIWVQGVRACLSVWDMFLNTVYYIAFKREYTVYLDKFAPEFLDLQTQEHSITIFIFLECSLDKDKCDK